MGIVCLAGIIGASRRRAKALSQEISTGIGSRAGGVARLLAAVTIAMLCAGGLAQAQTFNSAPTANPTSYSRIGDTTTFTVNFNTGGVAWNGVGTITSISLGAGYNGTVSNISCNLAGNN